VLCCEIVIMICYTMLLSCVMQFHLRCSHCRSWHCPTRPCWLHGLCLCNQTELSQVDCIDAGQSQHSDVVMYLTHYCYSATTISRFCLTFSRVHKNLKLKPELDWGLSVWVSCVNCAGYILTYSTAGADSEPVQIDLKPYMHQYVIGTTSPVEYTVDVAAITRRGAGPTRSRAGESCLL